MPKNLLGKDLQKFLGRKERPHYWLSKQDKSFVLRDRKSEKEEKQRYIEASF